MKNTEMAVWCWEDKKCKFILLNKQIITANKKAYHLKKK